MISCKPMQLTQLHDAENFFDIIEISDAQLCASRGFKTVEQLAHDEILARGLDPADFRRPVCSDASLCYSTGAPKKGYGLACHAWLSARFDNTFADYLGADFE